MNWIQLSAANLAPTANAGSDQTITLPAAAMLSGSISDDGLPNPPASTTVTWSKISGPGTVTFTNPNAAATNATFSTTGTYVLRLTGNDSVFTATDDCQVIVAGQQVNQPPVVTMPASIITAMPGASSAGAVALNATVSDDGQINPPVVTWTILSAPANGVVTFTNANSASTTASFTRIGTYQLQLDANDGALHSTGAVTVTVQEDPRADFDKNGVVDGLDFLIWQRNYNHGAVASGAPILDANFNDPNYARANGDANGDGKVDGSDFLVWQQDYVYGH